MPRGGYRPGGGRPRTLRRLELSPSGAQALRLLQGHVNALLAREREQPLTAEELVEHLIHVACQDEGLNEGLSDRSDP